MSIGLVGLIDDAAAQAARAGFRATCIADDDAEVTSQYVAGCAASRELPMIDRIALGSLKNKLLILFPAALAQSLLAPWAITPLLMLGSAFIYFEGAGKVLGVVRSRRLESDGRHRRDALGRQLLSTASTGREACQARSDRLHV